MSILGTVKKDAEDVKAFLLKVAGDAPAVATTVLNDVNEIVPVVNAFVPGASAVDAAIEGVLTAVETAVVGTGSAANANGLSVSLDQALVNDVKAIIAAAKKV